MTQPAIGGSPILGQFYRLIRVDTCGVPVTGSSSAQARGDGYVQVQVAPQYDTGDRKITRKANGLICVNYKLPDVFTADQLTIDFCVWCPPIIATVYGARLITATTPTSGTGVIFNTGDSALRRASLELWQAVAGDQACDASGNQRYLYHAWPNLGNWKRGNQTISNDPNTWQMMAESFPGSANWTVGNTWLGTNALVANDYYAFNFTTQPPPADASCTLLPYP